MDTLKAILNQILLFFDEAGEKIRRLSPRGRRRLLTMAAVFLLLVVLLMILLISSCRSSGQAITVEATEPGGRTRVRYEISAPTAQPWGEGEVSISSGVFPVNEPVATEPADEPEDDPTDDPTGEPEDEPSGEPEDEPTDEPSDEPSDEPTDDPDWDPDDIETVEETPEPTPDDEPEITPEPGHQYATLKKHDKSEAVTTLQYRLMELGYLDIDEPTNYFGTSTESAVVLFQRQHDLQQDGVAGNDTQTILYSDDAQHYMMKEGAEGDDVKALQEQLVDLGYLSEKDVDRVYGPITIAAVEAFQKRNNLHVDGLAGEKTLDLLYSDEAKISRELQKKLEAEAKKTPEPTKKPTATPTKKPTATPTKKATAKATAKPTATKKTSAKSTAKKTATPKPTVKKTATPKPTPKPTATPKKDTRIDKFIAAANSKLGCEYVLGARGPNKFDCSGFVYWCLKQAGVSGTRLSASGYSQKTGWKKIESIGDLKKGDILFFRSDTNSSVNHTGIYVGGGNMIDASSGNGKVVKRSLSAYWKRNFVWARRPWNE